MKEVVWFAAIVLLAAPGAIVWRVPTIARMGRPARFGLAFACGVLITVVLLYLYALIGIHWTRVNVGTPLLAFAIIGLRTKRQSLTVTTHDPLHLGIGAIFLLLTLYAVADARATCGDLLFIWAPKAQAFYTARTIDTDFLAFPHYIMMHPDYPPLVPLLYAWGSIVAHRFSFWGALFLTPLALLCLAAIARGFGATQRSTALLFAVLAYSSAEAYVAGAADPVLLLFEAVAVIALTFAPHSPEARRIAACALAGAAFTKVEGAAFAILVVIAFALVNRRLLQAVAMLIPSGVLLGSWLLFAWRHKLLDQYARAHSETYWPLLPSVIEGVLHWGSYRAAWLPWLAAAAPLFIHRSWRNAAFPLLVAAGSVCATLFFYLHTPDPSFWIITSAERILLTPLMCLCVASCATRPPEGSGGMSAEAEASSVWSAAATPPF